MKKIIIAILGITVLSFNGIYATAEELSEKNLDNNVSQVATQEIKLLNFEIPTEYSLFDTTVLYEELSNGRKAEVIDNSSKKVLATYSEIVENELSTSRMQGQVWTSHLQSTVNLAPTKINVYAEVVLRGDTNWRQIEKVNKIWQTEGQSGAFKLKDAMQSVNSPNVFPSTWMLVNVSGQVYTEKSWSQTAGFSFSLLDSAGFDMSGSESGSWFARKNYNSQVVFRVMY